MTKLQHSTPNQQRAIRFLLTKYPDTTKELLGSKSIDDLTFMDARQILDAIEKKHPRNKNGEGEDQKQEQKQDQQEEKKDNGGRQEFKSGTKEDVIANALRSHGMDVERTMAALTHADDYRDATEYTSAKIGRNNPLIFRQNVGGGRSALAQGKFHDRTDQDTQFGRARKTVYAVKRQMERSGEGQQEKQQEQREQQIPKNKHQSDADEMISWIQETLRPFCESRAADGHPIDEIGLRPAENSAKMLVAGIPVKAIKHALTMHYPKEARTHLAIRDYDVTTWTHREWKPEEVEAPGDVLEHDGLHQAMPYVKAIALAGMPTALVGPKGTGKTTLARQVAEDLELPFGMVSMTSGTSPSAFNGRPKIGGDGGVVQSIFEKLYSEGGVFLFDEMDAADENLILLVNAALANGQFANAATGMIVEQHKNFIPMAGMNTLGLGAGRDYNSRNKLDAATLDRWNAGRVQIRIDTKLESKIFWSIVSAKKNEEVPA